MHLSENPAESKAGAPQHHPSAPWRRLLTLSLLLGNVHLRAAGELAEHAAELSDRHWSLAADCVDLATFAGRVSLIVEGKDQILLPAVSR